MNYRTVLTSFILVQGQVNINFCHVLNEMGQGDTSQAWYFHTPDILLTAISFISVLWRMGKVNVMT